MRYSLVLMLSTICIFSGKCFGADTEQLQGLLLKNNCLACHMIDKRKYGPILREVSAKYAGDATAIERLAAKISAGGSGVWGEDIMPPQPHVSEAEARQIVELILALSSK